MTAFYNELDPFAASWLRELIKSGEIAPGVVDERSIEDIRPHDLDGYTQVHFFAGIGGWSYALRLAGWPDDCPVWTGSCPCQPFSAAGKGKGVTDERHLWPAFFHLITERRPPVVFGEQVAGKAGLAWLDLVSADLEGSGYAFGAADLCAAGVGAPHMRQRLFWVGNADSDYPRRDGGAACGAQAASAGEGVFLRPHGHGPGASGRARSMGDTTSVERERLGVLLQPRGPQQEGLEVARPSSSSSWDAPDWVLCNDPDGARYRPVEPGTHPLADGVPNRVGALRGYGNAIVPQVAAEFIGAFMETPA